MRFYSKSVFETTLDFYLRGGPPKPPLSSIYRLLPYIRMWWAKGFSGTLTGTGVRGEGILGAVTTPTAKAIGFSIGFSGHACGNPLRYVPKAPSEPVGPETLTLSVSSICAASFRSITVVAAGCDSLLAPLESAAKILPGDRLLTGTPPIFGCQGRRRPQTSIHILPREGGARGFLCRSMTTVRAS